MDVLIDDAGVVQFGPFLDQSAQAIRSSIEVNFYGVLSGCQLVLPGMVKRRAGHIINIASLAGWWRCPAKSSTPRTNSRSSGCSSRWPTSSPRTVSRSPPAADVHQHRADLRDGASSAQKPVEPRRSPQRSSKCSTNRSRGCQSPVGESRSQFRPLCCRTAAVAGSTRRWATTRCSSTSTPPPAGVTKTARNTRRASSSTRNDQRPRGAYMITPTPVRQTALPTKSHPSGRNPSSAIPHANEPVTTRHRRPASTRPNCESG